MHRRVFAALFLVLPVLKVGHAADIEGAVVIKHKLTKRKVTPNAGAYDRGVAVALDADVPQDPLAFERTHVVVYLEGEHAAASGPTAIIEQKNRRFVPDLLVVPVGATVSFPNLDPIFHNVFSLSKPKNFDLGNYPQGQTRMVTFTKPGVVLVNCRLHTNMAASIVVAPNRWCTKVDPSGRFLLRNVPAGQHTIVAWHKSAGFFRKTIVVEQTAGATVSFEIPLDENGMPTVATR